MPTFMVVATFPPEDLAEMMSVVAEEQAQVDTLIADGRLRSLHISVPRGTVFLDLEAEDEEQAITATRSLPMARWWALDAFPTAAPTARPQG